MKSTDNVGITFANLVVGRGISDHVLNVTLGAWNWTPNEDGSVDPDLVIVSRLRLTKSCAKQLRDSLVVFLDEIEKAEAQAVALAGSNGHDRQPDESLN